MTSNSTLDPDNMPVLSGQSQGHGHDIETLGPSDTSDSGSDMMGAKRGKSIQQPGVDAEGQSGLPAEDGSTSDSQGTGDRASVEPDVNDPAGIDIATDHATSHG